MVHRQENHVLNPTEPVEVYFHTLFKVFYAPLILHARFFLDDEDLAKDIVQEVFIHLWENRESFDFNQSTKSYLYKSVQHKCINYLKHKTVEDKYKEFNQLKISQAELYTDNFIEEQVGLLIEKELKASIAKAVDSLPERCRQTYILSREKNLTNKEIAEELNISVKAVERNMTRALSSLKKALKNYTAIYLIISLLLK